MEITWRVLCFYIGLSIIELCNGLPMDLLSTKEGPNAQLIGVLVAVMVSVCVVIAFVGCVCCQRRRGFKEFRDSPVTASVVNDSTLTGDDPGHVNPIANPEFTIFTPLSPPHHNNNVFRTHQPVISYIQNESIPEPQNKLNNTQIDGLDVSSWFDGSQSDFPRTKLKYIRELGNGWFGRVIEGEAQDIVDRQQEGWTPCAVRILESTASAHEQALFLHEANMYKINQPHINVLRLLGRSLEATPLLLIQELCSKGDLKKFLLENRSCSSNPAMLGLPLQFCCQLASAVHYLHDNNIPHLDLAARNCHLTTDMTLRVGDYGLAVNQYPNDYYQGTPAVPVRWCAPESLNFTSTTLQPKQVTCEDNIWSFGVTMWEVCEWGAQPYDTLTDDEVVSQVMAAPYVRLQKPILSICYINPLYRLMQLCWQNIESRPQIIQINSMLEHLMQVYHSESASKSPSKQHHEFPMSDFDTRWDTFKPNTIVKTDNHILQSQSSNIPADIHSISSIGEPYIEKSPSLTNLHGSFENLNDSKATGSFENLTEMTHLQGSFDLNESTIMDSWLQNVATDTGDMQYVRGLSQAIQALDSALASELTSSSSSSHQQSPAPESWDSLSVKTPPKIEFKLGLTSNPSLNDRNDRQSPGRRSPQRSESSETEDETWKKRIERGALSEKVRIKSKSVADLMVLTHIDQSDTDSETPLQSLEYKYNKNGRLALKNLETSIIFGSEGNLLAVQDTFQEELKKLQEERRDSLLFVPAYRDDETCDTVEDLNIECDPFADNVVNSGSNLFGTQTYIEKANAFTIPGTNSGVLTTAKPSKTSSEALEIKNQAFETKKPDLDKKTFDIIPIQSELIKEFIKQESQSTESFKIIPTVKNIDSSNIDIATDNPTIPYVQYEKPELINHTSIEPALKPEQNLQEIESYKTDKIVDSSKLGTENRIIPNVQLEEPELISHRSTDLVLNLEQNIQETCKSLVNVELESHETETKLEVLHQETAISKYPEVEMNQIVKVEISSNVKSPDEIHKVDVSQQEPIVTISDGSARQSETICPEENRNVDTVQKEISFKASKSVQAVACEQSDDRSAKMKNVDNLVQESEVFNNPDAFRLATFENIDIIGEGVSKTAEFVKPECANLTKPKLKVSPESNRDSDDPSLKQNTSSILNSDGLYEDMPELIFDNSSLAPPQGSPPYESENFASSSPTGSEPDNFFRIFNRTKDSNISLNSTTPPTFESSESSFNASNERSREFSEECSIESANFNVTTGPSSEEIAKVIQDYKSKFGKSPVLLEKFNESILSNSASANLDDSLDSVRRDMLIEYRKCREQIEELPGNLILSYLPTKQIAKDNQNKSKHITDNLKEEMKLLQESQIDSETLKTSNQSAKNSQFKYEINTSELENFILNEINFSPIDKIELSSSTIVESVINKETIKESNIVKEVDKQSERTKNNSEIKINNDIMANKVESIINKIEEPIQLENIVKEAEIVVDDTLKNALKQIDKIPLKLEAFKAKEENVVIEETKLERIHDENVENSKALKEQTELMKLDTSEIKQPEIIEEIVEIEKMKVEESQIINEPGVNIELKQHTALLKKDILQINQPETKEEVVVIEAIQVKETQTTNDQSLEIKELQELLKKEQLTTSFENQLTDLNDTALEVSSNISEKIINNTSTNPKNENIINTSSDRKEENINLNDLKIQKSMEDISNVEDTQTMSEEAKPVEEIEDDKYSESDILEALETDEINKGTFEDNLFKINNKQELSLIQNFINNERTIDSNENISTSLEKSQTSPDVTSTNTNILSLDSLNDVSPINQVYNVFNVTVDHHNPPNVFTSPVKSLYNRTFDKDEIINDINSMLLENELKQKSELSFVCTSPNEQMFNVFKNPPLVKELNEMFEIAKKYDKNGVKDLSGINLENLVKTNLIVKLDETNINNSEQDIKNDETKILMNEQNILVEDSKATTNLENIAFKDVILEKNETKITDNEDVFESKQLQATDVLRKEEHILTGKSIVTTNNVATENIELEDNLNHLTSALKHLTSDNIDLKNNLTDTSENLTTNIEIEDNPKDLPSEDCPENLTRNISHEIVTSNIDLNLSNDENNSKAVFTSTPFHKKKSMTISQNRPTDQVLSFVSEGDDITNDYQTTVILGPCEDYALGLYTGLKTTFEKYSDDDRPEEELLQFSSNFMPLNNESCNNYDDSVDYSLDTWDRFLGKSFEDQKQSVFDNFTPKNNFENTLDCDEPRSLNPNLTFEITNPNLTFNLTKQIPNINLEKTINIHDSKLNPNITFEVINPNLTFEVNPNHTFDLTKVETEENATFILDNNDNKNLKDSASEPISSSWEPGEGWFLHPQTAPEDLKGEIDISGSDSIDNSYVGFTLDEECVNALRNELAAKLPHAQGILHEEPQEPDDWDSEERNEVIVKYNVYATPLSPIPEESCCDDVYCDQIQHRDGSDTDSDWSEPCLGRTSQLEDILVVDTETHTAQIFESPSLREPPHRHTPSQDSCCSNDTLFNLEDLNYGPNSPLNHPNLTQITHINELDQHEQELILQVELTDNETLKLSLSRESDTQMNTQHLDSPNDLRNFETNNAEDLRFYETKNNENSRHFEMEYTKNSGDFVTESTKNSGDFQTDYTNNSGDFKTINSENSRYYDLKNSETSANFESANSDISSIEMNKTYTKPEIKINKTQITNLKLISPENKFESSISSTVTSSKILEIEATHSETIFPEVLIQNSNVSSLVRNSNKLDFQPKETSISIACISPDITIINPIVSSTQPKGSNNIGNQTELNSVNVSPTIHIQPEIEERSFYNLESKEHELNKVELQTSDTQCSASELSSMLELNSEPEREIELNLNLQYPEIQIINQDFLDSERASSNNQELDLEPELNCIELQSSEGQILKQGFLTPSPNKLQLNLDPEFNAAPLPSPEDIPWRQLPASLLTYNEVSQNDKFEMYEDSQQDPRTEDQMRENSGKTEDELSDSAPECTDLYSNLTDIRFSGPCDTQLMSTSFSESAEFADDRDWDSGSDTRSSSSGEFIWKEGEHEESLRALHAASHDVGVIEDIRPMDAIEEEENSNSSNDDSDDCEEDIEETEFVPSAWDSQATPTKSALRSPEKSNKRKNQPQKGVWFKKQKYHCVYEYPREPESPVAPSSDLWRPLSDFSNFTDWELDPDACVPPFDDQVMSDARDVGYDSVFNKFIARNNYPLTSASSRHRDLYQLNPFTDLTAGMSSTDEDFFISSSARPFQALGQGSQFFPGQDTAKTKSLWSDYQTQPATQNDNITPDSGVEDVTPASITSDNGSVPAQTSPVKYPKVQTLKILAELATKKTQIKTDSLGGLRHTRNRLKLDLPPSPNSFTASRTFTIDVSSNDDPVINREMPTFTTFGKSRFSVQHVATPTEETAESFSFGSKIKNVSFEALPHKPEASKVFILDDTAPEKAKHKPGVVEMVQGEASLLDSADEDSGIESSANATLERHQQQILNHIE